MTNATDDHDRPPRRMRQPQRAPNREALYKSAFDGEQSYIGAPKTPDACPDPGGALQIRDATTNSREPLGATRQPPDHTLGSY